MTGKPESSEAVSRRRILSSASGLTIGVLAGCMSRSKASPDYQLRIFNGYSQPVNVTIRIADGGSGAVLLTDSVQLDSAQDKTYQNIFTEGGRVTVHITVNENRSKAVTWTLSDNPGDFHKTIEITDDHIGVVTGAH